MSKFCTVCGVENKDDAIFCGNCGKILDGVNVNDSNLENKVFDQNAINNPHLNNNKNKEPSNYNSSLSVPQKYNDYNKTWDFKSFQTVTGN